VREGGTSRCRLPWKPGGSPDPREARGCLPGRCPRSSEQGGNAGRPTGRTPCLPDRLPAWVPATLCDHELIGVVLAAHIRPGAGPRARHRLTESLCSPTSAVEGLAERAPTRRLPPATVQVIPEGPVTRRAYRGRGPLYPAQPGRAPHPGTADWCQQASTALRAQRNTIPSGTMVRGPRRPLFQPRLARSHRGA
jgi:hypothetical protein